MVIFQFANCKCLPEGTHRRDFPMSDYGGFLFDSPSIPRWMHSSQRVKKKLMWFKQCHQLPMTGNGKHSTVIKMVMTGGMTMFFFEIFDKLMG